MPLYSGDINLLLTDGIDLLIKDFGVNVQYYSHENMASTPIRVRFIGDSKVLDENMGIEVSSPVAICTTSDIPDVGYEDMLIIDGDEYKITSINHKNNGSTTLGLSLKEATA